MGVWTPGPGPTTGNDIYDGDNSNETVSGGDGDDTLNGNGGNDTLNGDAGNDTLNGGSGDDTLSGGQGDDLYDGGDGFDRIRFDVVGATQGVIASLATQTISNDGFGNAETMSSIEALGPGTAFADTFQGDGGNNLLLGSLADTLVGGAGDDTLAIDALTASIDGGDGIDTLDVSAYDENGFGPFVLLYLNEIEDAFGNVGAITNVENVTGSTRTESLAGNAGANVIIGNGGFDEIYGRQGDDTLVGGSVSDLIVGGSDTDNITGGDGNDFLYGDGVVPADIFVAGNDVISGGAGDDYILGGDGADWMDGGAGAGDLVDYSYSDAGVAINLAANTASGGDATGDTISGFENVRGSSLNDTLIGNALSNTLEGAGGADQLDGGAGTDTASYASSANAVSVNLATGTGSGGDAAGDTLTRIENITGSSWNDTLTGDAANNTLNGNAGADTLVGGLGVDTINGGAGNDVINWLWGDGNGAIDGGADSDTFSITGTAASNILKVNFNGSVLIAAAGNTLASIEAVNAAMGGGGDLLEYVAASSAATVNLALGTASGFASLSGITHVTGGSGNDNITGDAQANKLSGGDGDDTLSGGDGLDTLTGGNGADTIYGGLGNDGVDAGAGNDNVIWNWGDGGDTINGGADFDTVTFVGTAASNLFKIAFDGTKITSVMGNPLSNVEAVVANTGGGGDWLIYKSATTSITVNLATGVASGLASFSGVSHVQGGTGNDVFTGDDFFNKLDGGDGNDTLSGGGDNDVLTGGNGADTLTGGTGLDTIDAGSGNDTIYWAWNDGGDTVDGGAGTDTITFTGDSAVNLIKASWNGSVLTQVMSCTLTGVESVNAVGGGGADWLIYTATDGVSVDLRDNTASGFASITGFSNLQGGAGNDILVGDAGANKLLGGAGDDIIAGLEGNDIIDGGADTDTLSYSPVAAGVTVSLATTAAQNTGGAGTDTISNVENLAGSQFDDTLSGNASANLLIGNDGNDTLNGAGGVDALLGGLGNDSLNGGTGADTMDGGAGDDAYYVDDAGDTVNDTGDGTDSVYASISYSLANQNADNLYLSGADLDGTGNTLANTIVGTNGANTLTGNGGADTLSGLDGDDILVLNTSVSGAGSVDGGAGTDTLLLNSSGGDFFLWDWTLASIEKLSLNSSAFYYISPEASLASNLEVIGVGSGASATLAIYRGTTGGVVSVDLSGWTFTNFTGTLNIFGDASPGNSTADILIGSVRADVIAGNGGADTINGNGGNDQINGGDGDDTASGGAGADTLTGGNGADTLNGDADNDTLTGGAGNDVLNGGTGVDAMDGGVGDDTYYVDDASDVVNDTGDGTDSVYSTVSYSLVGAIADNLYLSGGDLDGTGSHLANIIVGTNGANTLTGNGGADTLSGLDGNDILVLNTSVSGAGSVDGGAGTDTLRLTSSGGDFYLWTWTIASIEQLSITSQAFYYLAPEAGLSSTLALTATGSGANATLAIYRPTGGAVTVDLSGWTFTNWSGTIDIFGDVSGGNSSADTLTGSSQADFIFGYGGDDLIKGKDGADQINGGDGNDYIQGDDGVDTIHGGDGADIIYANAGLAGESLYGDAGNDTLYGGGNGDILDGGTGADALVGGDGNDSYYVDNAGDTVFDTGAGDTADAVYASVSFSLDGTDADNLYLSGAALNGTGSASNNIIVGNGNDNSLTGGGGDDTLTGGLGADTFVYAAGAGNDTISDFDADAASGQDLIDITGFGITAGDFGARVTITDLGASTLVTIDGSVTITLTGVTGDGDNIITSADFLLGP